MTRKQLRESVERYLQDSKNDRWKDDEINAYIDEAQMEFCRLAKIVAADVTANLVTVDTRRTLAVLTTSGRTITDTLVAPAIHILAVGDSVLISDTTDNYRKGGHLVTSVPSNTTSVSSFQYLLPDNVSQTTSETVTVVETGPVYTKDSTILEITSVTLDGRELAAYTQSDLDAASNKYKNSSIYVRTALGSTPSPFSNLDAGSPTRWRDSHGQIEGFVMSQRSATTFRVFPLPSNEEHVYIDKDASTKVSQTLRVQGVLNPIALASDTSTPQIPESYHESLVYGALDRAYLKESQMRNMDKAQLFRVKFLEIAAEARKQEGFNSGSLAKGRNQVSMRVWR